MLNKIALTLLLITSVFSQCTPGTLNTDTVDQLPQSDDLTLSFGTSYDLGLSTTVIQTDAARKNFKYKFVNPTDSTECTPINADIGAESASGTCIVPITASFTWPPQQDCFDKTVDTDNNKDVFTAILVLSWEEPMGEINGVNIDRTVSVQRSVEVTIPNQLSVTANFISSSSSTINLINTFLVTSAEFSVNGANTDYNIRILTLTSVDSSNEMMIEELDALTSGTIAEFSSPGSSQSPYWMQQFDWDLTEVCTGMTKTYNFRATFKCTASSGNEACESDDYNGDFEDISLTVTIGNVCPTVSGSDFQAVATIELLNGNGRAQTVFSNLDSISAKISSITNELVLTSASVVSVEVNDDPWTEGVQIVSFDTTDAKHPVIIFAPTQDLLDNEDLKNSPTEANDLVVTLSLTWDQGGVTKKQVRSKFSPSTTAQINFAVVEEKVSSATSLAASVVGFVFLALFLVVF